MSAQPHQEETQIEDLTLGQSESLPEDEPPHAVQGTTVHDVQLDDALKSASRLVCIKCNIPCDPFKAVLKHKLRLQPGAGRFICRSCNSITTMLVRNMTWPPPLFSELSDDQQAVFWRACAETNDHDSRFSYSKVRASLLKSLCERKTVEDSVEEFTAFKPLSVWQAAGWDIALIEKNGKKDTNPVVGDVYAVPVKNQSSKVIYARVEEHLQRAEQLIKQKKKRGEDDPHFDDPSDLESESSEPGKKPTGSKRAGGNSSGKKSSGSKKARKETDPDKEEARQQAKEDKAQEKRRQSAMKKKAKDIQSFSTRALSAMAGPLGEIRMAVDTVNGSGAGKFPPMMTQSLQEHLDSLSEWRAQATAAVMATSKAVIDDIEDLQFDQTTLQAAIKKAKDTLKTFNEVSRLVHN